MAGRLESQVAIITGAGSGIGRATAQAFAREGARVVMADANLPGAEETVALIHAATMESDEEPSEPRAVPFRANVASAADASALVDFTLATFGALDILVNNAGVGVAGNILTTSEEDWDRIFAVNVKGVYQCSRAALPRMIERGGGVIVNVSSVLALVAAVDRAAYTASKGAVLALTKAMAADHVKDGVRVNCVCPGTVDTPWVGRMVASYPDPEAACTSMEARQPVGRLGTPEEIARAIVYLASPDAAFATGSALVIDGGFSAFKLPS